MEEGEEEEGQEEEGQDKIQVYTGDCLAGAPYRRRHSRFHVCEGGRKKKKRRGRRRRRSRR